MNALAVECRTLTRYLIDVDAEPDVVAAYQRAHEVGTILADKADRPLDRALIHIAHWGPRFARAADGYAAVFAPAGLLRRKLVLLVAILESRRGGAAVLDTAAPGSRLIWGLLVSAQVAGRLLMTCVAVFLVAPIWAWYAFRKFIHLNGARRA